MCDCKLLITVHLVSGVQGSAWASAGDRGAAEGAGAASGSAGRPVGLGVQHQSQAGAEPRGAAGQSMSHTLEHFFTFIFCPDLKIWDFQNASKGSFEWMCLWNVFMQRHLCLFLSSLRKCKSSSQKWSLFWSGPITCTKTVLPTNRARWENQTLHRWFIYWREPTGSLRHICFFHMPPTLFCGSIFRTFSVLNTLACCILLGNEINTSLFHLTTSWAWSVSWNPYYVLH